MSQIVDMRGRPMTVARAWDAAKPDLIRSNWPVQSRPPDADIRYGLERLRSRARHEAQNNDHARAFLRECKVNVIGHKGIRLQSKARMQNGRADERARKVIEEAWIDWGDTCELSGRWHWVDLQHQCIETVARDGEAVFRMHDGADGFQLQAIDPETLDVHLNEAKLSNGNRIVMGVEVTREHMPVAYYFNETDELHLSYRTGTRIKQAERVPADEILHVYLPEWVSQTRGIPWMASALRRMTDLNGYDESAVVAARAGASKMGWFLRSEDAPPNLDEKGLPVHDTSDSEGPGGQLYQNFDPGSIGDLPPGVTFEGWDPRYPHSEHGSFTKAVLRGIASGLGVSYNTLANDAEGVNYSSLRHFALVEREVWKALQEWLIRSFHQKVYRKWLDAALTLGLTDPRGRPLSVDRTKEFQRVYWQPRRWQWVDPAKEAAAARTEIEMRARSLSSVIRERGDDPEEVWREIQAENEMLAEMGISPAQAMAAATEIDDDQEDA